MEVEDEEESDDDEEDEEEGNGDDEVRCQTCQQLTDCCVSLSRISTAVGGFVSLSNAFCRVLAEKLVSLCLSAEIGRHELLMKAVKRLDCRAQRRSADQEEADLADWDYFLLRFCKS